MMKSESDGRMWPGYLYSHWHGHMICLADGREQRACGVRGTSPSTLRLCTRADYIPVSHLTLLTGLLA